MANTSLSMLSVITKIYSGVSKSKTLFPKSESIRLFPSTLSTFVLHNEIIESKASLIGVGTPSSHSTEPFFFIPKSILSLESVIT